MSDAKWKWSGDEKIEVSCQHPLDTRPQKSDTAMMTAAKLAHHDINGVVKLAHRDTNGFVKLAHRDSNGFVKLAHRDTNDFC